MVVGCRGDPWVVSLRQAARSAIMCFALFRGRGELAGVAQAFVAEGLARQERVVYVGPGRPRDLRHDLLGIRIWRTVSTGASFRYRYAAFSASDASSVPVDELIDLAAMTQDSRRRIYRSADGRRRDDACGRSGAAGPVRSL